MAERNPGQGKNNQQHGKYVEAHIKHAINVDFRRAKINIYYNALKLWARRQGDQRGGWGTIAGKAGKAEKRGSRADMADSHTYAGVRDCLMSWPCVCVCTCACVCASAVSCVSYAPYLIRDLIAFCWKFIWRNKQQRCPRCLAENVAERRPRELPRQETAGSKDDTHNCSIISHKVKNCCSILGVIQSRLHSRSGRARQTWLLYENVLWYEHRDVLESTQQTSKHTHIHTHAPAASLSHRSSW